MFLERFDEWLRKYATQATMILSVVVGVTGVFMFFHLFRGTVSGIHEWLGMAFVAIAFLHAFRHRRMVVQQITQTRTKVLAGGLIAATVTVMALSPQEPSRGEMAHQLTDRVQRIPLADLAPALGLPSEALIAHLRLKGLQVESGAASVDSVAKASQTDPQMVLRLAMDAPR